jgi:hypothetical protein
MTDNAGRQTTACVAKAPADICGTCRTKQHRAGCVPEFKTLAGQQRCGICLPNFKTNLAVLPPDQRSPFDGPDITTCLSSPASPKQLAVNNIMGIGKVCPTGAALTTLANSLKLAITKVSSLVGTRVINVACKNNPASVGFNNLSFTILPSFKLDVYEVDPFLATFRLQQELQNPVQTGATNNWVRFKNAYLPPFQSLFNLQTPTLYSFCAAATKDTATKWAVLCAQKPGTGVVTLSLTPAKVVHGKSVTYKLTITTASSKPQPFGFVSVYDADGTQLFSTFLLSNTKKGARSVTFAKSFPTKSAHALVLNYYGDVHYKFATRTLTVTVT